MMSQVFLNHHPSLTNHIIAMKKTSQNSRKLDNRSFKKINTTQSQSVKGGGGGTIVIEDIIL